MLPGIAAVNALAPPDIVTEALPSSTPVGDLPIRVQAGVVTTEQGGPTAFGEVQDIPFEVSHQGANPAWVVDLRLFEDIHMVDPTTDNSAGTGDQIMIDWSSVVPGVLTVDIGPVGVSVDEMPRTVQEAMFMVRNVPGDQFFGASWPAEAPVDQVEIFLHGESLVDIAHPPTSFAAAVEFYSEDAFGAGALGTALDAAGGHSEWEFLEARFEGARTALEERMDIEINLEDVEVSLEGIDDSWHFELKHQISGVDEESLTPAFLLDFQNPMRKDATLGSPTIDRGEVRIQDRAVVVITGLVSARVDTRLEENRMDNKGHASQIVFSQGGSLGITMTGSDLIELLFSASNQAVDFSITLMGEGSGIGSVEAEIQASGGFDLAVDRNSEALVQFRNMLEAALRIDSCGGMLDLSFVSPGSLLAVDAQAGLSDGVANTLSAVGEPIALLQDLDDTEMTDMAGDPCEGDGGQDDIELRIENAETVNFSWEKGDETASFIWRLQESGDLFMDHPKVSISAVPDPQRGVDEVKFEPKTGGSQCDEELDLERSGEEKRPCNWVADLVSWTVTLATLGPQTGQSSIGDALDTAEL